MEESITLIKHKWELGIYELVDMMNFVLTNAITKQDFFEITRYNYDSIIKTRNYTKVHQKLSF